MANSGSSSSYLCSSRSRNFYTNRKFPFLPEVVLTRCSLYNFISTLYVPGTGFGSCSRKRSEGAPLKHSNCEAAEQSPEELGISRAFFLKDLLACFLAGLSSLDPSQKCSKKCSKCSANRRAGSSVGPLYGMLCGAKASANTYWNPTRQGQGQLLFLKPLRNALGISALAVPLRSGSCTAVQYSRSRSYSATFGLKRRHKSGPTCTQDKPRPIFEILSPEL